MCAADKRKRQSRGRQPTARGQDLACQTKSSGPQPLCKLQ